MLEYTVKSTYRFLYQKEGLHNYEIAILNFIKQKLPYIINNEGLIQAFKKLKDSSIYPRALGKLVRQNKNAQQ